MSVLLSGKELADKIITETAQKVSELQRRPVLAGVIVGEDQASQVYFRSKEKDCERCGIESRKYILPSATDEEALLELLDRLNNDTGTDGILVQLPLPRHINEKRVLEAIAPAKDVDSFNPLNSGRLFLNGKSLLPCTPAAVMEILDYYNIDPSGKDCVVIGRSNIVGKPAAILLLHRNATVTICHSKTADLKSKTLAADIIVSAAGKQNMLTADMIKPGAVIIDVSINRNPETGKLCGDCDFDACAEKAGMITPVPGGVGPVTRALLMRNVLIAASESLILE